jgi:hypothetical protein
MLPYTEQAPPMRKFPDLPEIMAAGFGLTEALAVWSRMVNTPGLTPEDARTWLSSDPCRRKPALASDEPAHFLTADQSSRVLH